MKLKDGIIIPIISSVGESFVTHPMDVIRTRFTNRTQVWRGIRSMYAGFSYKAIGLIPDRIVLLGGDTIGKKYNIGFVERSIVLGNVQSIVDLPFLMYTTGAIEGVPQKILQVPTGFTPLMCRNVIFALGLFGARDLSPFSNYYVNTMIGCTIGVGMSQPFEVIRSRKQSIQKDLTLNEIRKHVYSSYGAYGFWRGVFARGGIAMVSFLTLSFFQKTLNDYF
jgi:hypothetical protein